MLKSVLLGLAIGGGAWFIYKQLTAGSVVAGGSVNGQIGRSFVTTTGESVILREDESGRVYDNQGRLWV